MTRRCINFGVMLQGPGCNMNAWKHPSVPADASINFGFYVERARAAEAAGLDFAFIADGLYIHERSFPHFLNRFEPIALLSALAATTSKIGLVGTVSTSYSDPFTVARQLASIDTISGGRVGWNCVTSPLEGSGRNYSRPHPAHDLRYEIAEEYLDVITGLWDSWDDDAFIRDRTSGRFFDARKMHRLNHRGRFFAVEGPLNIARSTQGQPLIILAGASEEGVRLAGKCADAVFTNGGSFDDGRAFYQKIKESAKAHGRSPDDVKVFPGIGPVVGPTEELARERHCEIKGLITIDDALIYLSHFFEQHDFSVYPLDAPFPDLEDLGKDGFRSTSDNIKRRARELGQTLREVALETATQRVHIGTSDAFIGEPDRVADELIRWVEGGAADGFMLGLPVLGFGLDDFVQQVLPVLAKRGYHDTKRATSTLRERLGLTYRQSRHVVSQGSACEPMPRSRAAAGEREARPLV